MSQTKAAGTHPMPRKRAIVSVLIGNLLEFFDFAVYGFLAATIGQVFFSGGTPAVQLLASLAVFGVGFLFRPVGGAIFGYLADKFGRKVSLSSAIIIMSVATAMIGILPGYSTIGLWAPALLVVARALQGISVGGEWSGASTFIMEFAPAARRGLWVSLTSTTAALGVVLGSSLVLLLTAALPSDQMMSWGWRIPFLLAFPAGLLGLYMRLKLEDTPVFLQMQRDNEVTKSPFRSLTRRDIGYMALTVVFSGATGLGFYYFSTYFNTYLSSNLGFDRTLAIILSMISLVFYALLCPFAGILSDRFGRKRIYVIGCLAMSILAVPIFLLMGLGTTGALIGMLIFAFPMSLINVMVAAVLVELFTARTRATAGAIGFNIGVGFIAGTGPLIAAALVTSTGNPLAPGWYLAAIEFVAAIILVFALPETFKRSLFLHAEPTARDAVAPPAEAARP